MGGGRHGPRIVVIGAGISGLAAAWEAAQGGSVSVTVIEESERCGGKIGSGLIGATVVDTGPDAFLARSTTARELAGELELPLVAPRASGAFVWSRGRLRRLPEGLVLGVPARLAPVALSGIVSPRGVARAALDLVLPPTRLPGDPSVAEVIRARFGAEVAGRIVEPLLGGIHAGTPESLSLREVAPQVAEALASGRSALVSLRKMAPGPSDRNAGAPVFLAPEGGMHQMVTRLAGGLRDRGVDIRTSLRVRRCTTDGAGVVVSTEAGVHRCDAAILTVPAPDAPEVVPSAGEALGGTSEPIRYASVGVVTLAFPGGSIPDSLPGTGFVVPRSEGRLMTATTWLSTKWDHYRRAQQCLVRCSVGRRDDERFSMMDDGEVVSRVHSELLEAMGTIGVVLPPRPDGWLVTRWPAALPQYETGHRGRVRAIREAFRSVPGVFLAGAYLDGVGVPACIESGRAAAREALVHASRPC